MRGLISGGSRTGSDVVSENPKNGMRKYEFL
jgi:hypothetical protein